MAVFGALVVVTHQVRFRTFGVVLNSFLVSWKDEVELPFSIPHGGPSHPHCRTLSLNLMIGVGVGVVQDGAVCQQMRLSSARPARSKHRYERLFRGSTDRESCCVRTYELGVRSVAVTDFNEAEGIGEGALALALLVSFLPTSGGTAEAGNEYTVSRLP